MTLNEWSIRVFKWRVSREFVTPSTLGSIESRDQMLGKLMLVVSEVSEAAEAVRHYDYPNFKEELADTFIRLLDICGTMGIDVEKIISDKMIVNDKRPVRHDKKTSL